MATLHRIEQQRWPLGLPMRSPRSSSSSSSSARISSLRVSRYCCIVATAAESTAAEAAPPKRGPRETRDVSKGPSGGASAGDIGRGMGAEFDTVVTNSVGSASFKIAKVPTMEERDFRAAAVIEVADVAQGVRCITVDAECSREFIPREQAYTKSGQMAQVRFLGQESSIKVPVSSSPFSWEVNHAVTMKARADVPSGTQKLPQFFLSVKSPLQLHVTESEAPEFYGLKQGDEIELGPLDSSGMDLRPVLFITQYPTLLIFAQGKGIAAAKALIETKDADVSSLNLRLRRDVRLFYVAPRPELLAYKEKFAEWEKKKVKVCTSVEAANDQWDGQVGSFQELWDEDDLEYDPRSTAVVVCAEAGAEQELDELLENADIVKEQTVKWII
ncbi:uncharacterized protein LOC9633104 [Selaginella moellendorffii]|uniref:uncharacterized protein LOC9633104 n=1 Tax=Selaginella moellendorffii TaxID=88036 RepID=UPI000D1C94A4|nr:uncharacterized protein LOC9633104 [Selaginella moellendorffii]|eukprot:XP_002967932.2 uncharacterized protein LOC9633104 [Selaginella moellendorffii]